MAPDLSLCLRPAGEGLDGFRRLGPFCRPGGRTGPPACSGRWLRIWNRDGLRDSGWYRPRTRAYDDVRLGETRGVEGHVEDRDFESSPEVSTPWRRAPRAAQPGRSFLVWSVRWSERMGGLLS